MEIGIKGPNSCLPEVTDFATPVALETRCNLLSWSQINHTRFLPEEKGNKKSQFQDPRIFSYVNSPLCQIKACLAGQVFR